MSIIDLCAHSAYSRESNICSQMMFNTFQSAFSQLKAAVEGTGGGMLEHFHLHLITIS